MKVNWLVDHIAFADAQRIYNEVTRQGMRCETMASMPDEPEKDWIRLYGPNDCVVSYGSLSSISLVKRTTSWVPGFYCNLKAFDCTSYYPYFGYNLINQHYLMMPYGDLKRRKEFIFEVLGVDTVFIKPDSGGKKFTGKLFDFKTFDKEVDNLDFYYVDNGELCVVAPAQNIISEYRFVVVNGEIVAGSQYLPYREPVMTGGAFELAKKMAPLYKPDAAWTIDICETKLFTHVLEINSFSCAGLYECDIEKVVSKVSEAALKGWQEFQP